MAKGNLFLGHARGKVGSVVFSRLAGQQISKAYNANPSNPKTRAQALQRAQFSTVVAASVALKEIINNSFDGAKNGQDSVNNFVSRNLSDLRARGFANDYIANEWLVPKGQSFIQPQPWILSHGSVGTLTNLDLKNLVGALKIAGNNDLIDGEPTYYITGRQLANALYYKPGCQLTFVAITLEVNPTTSAYTLRPIYHRIVFSSLAPLDDTTKLIISLDSATPYIPAEYVDLTKTTLSVEDNRVYLPEYIQVLSVQNEHYLVKNVTDEYGNQVTGLGIITTHNEDGEYKHTNSTFVVDADAYDYNEDAVSSYMNSNVSKIRSSDYYTEQSDTSLDDNSNITLPEVVSAVLSGRGMTEKGVYLEQSNSYGPVAEGTPVTLQITTAYPFQIANNSIKAYNGEKPLDNDWTILRGSSRSYIITGPMPTTASFPLNVSFDVYDPSDGSNLGRAALRINISKANS